MYAPIHPVAGIQPLNDWFEPDTTQRFPLGMVIDAVDPYWGFGRFVYGKSAAALNIGNLATAVATFNNWDKTPNTANLGQPCSVVMNEMAINEYGWFQIEGICFVKSSATVAALAAVGLTSAGVIGANTAGKQILGYTQLVAQTGTKALTNVATQNGTGVLVTQGYDGWRLGMALSGTGIPASTVVAKLDPDGRTVYTGSAVGTVGDKNSTATGAVTVTATYTGYSIGQIMAPFVQGAIT